MKLKNLGEPNWLALLLEDYLFTINVLSILTYFRVVTDSEKIIDRNFIKLRKLNENVCWNIALSKFIVAINLLK